MKSKERTAWTRGTLCIENTRTPRNHRRGHGHCPHLIFPFGPFAKVT